MYQPMLYLHWKQIRLVLLPLTIAAFALPVMSVAGLGAPAGSTESALSAYTIVEMVRFWLPVFPALAAAVGITLALSAWNWDHRLGHVYALSLPLSRGEYTLLKMGAGATLAMLPGIALWLGAHVAAAAVTLPPGLRAYPDQLALRFALATLVAYSVLFAMAAGTVKTTVWIVAAVSAFVVFGAIGTDWLLTQDDLAFRYDPVRTVIDWIMQGPGPLGVFTSNWSLIDV